MQKLSFIFVSCAFLISGTRLAVSQQISPLPVGNTAETRTTAGSSATAVPYEAESLDRDPRYRLRANDTLSLSYRYTPEFNATVTIQPDGFAVFPLLGELHLAGLPADKARALIQQRAGARLINPEIAVTLKEFEKPYYVVGGEVGTPGRYQLSGRITALEALEIAGGIRESGKSNQVLLIHPLDESSGAATLINLKPALNKGNVGNDVVIHAGDILLVPKTRVAKVDPYIKLANPGSYGLYVNPLQ